LELKLQKESETVVKKLLKYIPKKVIYIMLCLLLAIVLGFVVNIRGKAKSIGNFLGESLGTNVGKVMGSFDALTHYKEAYAEGKEEGLSAKDTTAEVVSKIQELNKLEVLVASVKLNDIHSVGKEDNPDYAALYLLKGNAVFTVDLSKVEIQDRENEISILLPEPEMELIIDQREIEKVAEYQKNYFKGSAEDGFDAYLASMSKIDEQSEEVVANYDELIKMARESARKQVEQLVGTVSVSETNVKVGFQAADQKSQKTDTASENGTNETDDQTKFD
jgi:hypothetical protein